MGHVFHFTKDPQGLAYPASSFKFPAAVAYALQGMTFDAVAVVADSNRKVLAASNPVRFTIQ